MVSVFWKRITPIPRKQVDSELEGDIVWFSFKDTPFLQMEFPTGESLDWRLIRALLGTIPVRFRSSPGTKLGRMDTHA